MRLAPVDERLWVPTNACSAQSPHLSLRCSASSHDIPTVEHKHRALPWGTGRALACPRRVLPSPPSPRRRRRRCCLLAASFTAATKSCFVRRRRSVGGHRVAIVLDAALELCGPRCRANNSEEARRRRADGRRPMGGCERASRAL